MVDSGEEFMVYQEMKDVIVAVALVRLKPGVFDKSCEWGLVLVSTSEIRLLGVKIHANGELQLFSDDVTVGTDDIVMISACGLDNGQIFLGGRDGNLYEFDYESEETWFTRRCNLINHTRSRVAMFIPTFLSLSSPGMLLQKKPWVS